MKNRCIIIMGVSGSGKSVTGKLLAEKLGYTFVEGDDLHPKNNVDKMHSGIPLTDEDRMPWLDLVISEAQKMLAKNSCVVACSALKKKYRDHLRGIGSVTFIYLHGSFELMYGRMGNRKGHFMPKSLLQSQFDALQEPGTDEPDVVRVDNSFTPENVAQNALAVLQQGDVL